MALLTKDIHRLWNMIAVFAVLIAFSACDGKDDDGIDLNDDDLTTQDRNFATEAAYANRAEIELGELAVDMATDSRVIAYAEMMITDHTNAQNRLKDIARDEDITVPDTLNTEHREIYNQLAAMEGMAFDSAYVEQMIIDHEKALDLFTTQVQEGSEDDLVNYASSLIPDLEAHQDEALELDAELSGTDNGGS